MDLILVGLSRFAKKRVLPAAALMQQIERIDVVTSQEEVGVRASVPKLGDVHRRWAQALSASPPSLVYVSVVNSLHVAVVTHALKCGHHVVVDKPALQDVATATLLEARARAASVVLAESIIYPFHPIFPTLESIVGGLDSSVTSALAVFTPPVPLNDWRWSRAAGGGAFADTGPYAMSLGRVLWGMGPEQISVAVNSRNEEGLETSFSMFARYPGGRAISGQFGFTAKYQNELRMAGEGFEICVNRPFSAPPDMVAEIHVRIRGEEKIYSVEPADSMRRFLAAVIEAIDTHSSHFALALLQDAAAVSALRLTSADPQSDRSRAEMIATPTHD